MAPPPTQPISKLEGIGRSPLGGAAGGSSTGARRSTGAELLQEKFNVKARGRGSEGGLLALLPALS